jgi:predicted alpha/beta-hydrolase family hydrolase
MQRGLPAVTSDAVIYLPGIMGSELVDGQGNVVWGLKPSLIFRQAIFGNVLDQLALRAGNEIVASRPLQFPAKLPLLSDIEPYRNLEERLKRVVVHPDAVRPFAYDWRKSIAEAAERLALVARAHLEEWRRRFRALPVEARRRLPEPRLTLVGHSMGGLVASYFAAFGEGGEAVSRIVTLGTPFGGSLNALNALANGREFPFGAFAGALRATTRTMPGLYELVARWGCVADEGLRELTPADHDRIGASRELAEAAAATMGRLANALAGKAGRCPPVRCLVGTTQPTFQSVAFRNGVPDFLELLDGTDNRGDGTVYRYAAVPEGATPSSYLPQSHGAVAKSDEGIEFVAAVLSERKLGTFQAPSGVGLRVPEVVGVNAPFTVDVVDGEPGLPCRLENADEDRLVMVRDAELQDGALRVTFSAPEPGLYRVAVAGAGYGAVQRLVAATG